MTDKEFYEEKIKQFHEIHDYLFKKIPFFGKDYWCWVVGKSVAERMRKYLSEQFKINKEVIVECLGIELIEFDDEYLLNDIYLMDKKVVKNFIEAMKRERGEL